MATETEAITYKSVQLSHGTTRYFETGSGHSLILLHGSGIEQGGADFLPCMAMLGRELHVLAPDFVGWPPSDSFSEIASFPYLVDFVREFQDALGLRSSHIAGVSMGGWIAGLFAYESPGRVDKLVIGGNPGLYGSPNRRMAEWQAPEDQAVREWLGGVTKVPGVDGEALLSDKLAKLREDGTVDAFGKLMRHMANDANRGRYALERRLRHIQAPTLFFWGKADPTVEQASLSQDLLPGSQVKLLEAGHRMHIEEPALFSQAILQFLA
jgi:2-hydroxy-6-oxonona-2,4-dienedioate hydrolase